VTICAYCNNSIWGSFLRI